LISISFTFS